MEFEHDTPRALGEKRTGPLFFARVAQALATVRVRSQPWPFPASLMIGAYVEAKSTKIAVNLEELEDCRWFSRDEVRQMLASTLPTGWACPRRCRSRAI